MCAFVIFVLYVAKLMSTALALLALADVGSGEDDHSPVDTIPLLWFVLPSFVLLLIYTAISFAVWPYARPIMPIWTLLLFILLPPFFPFLLFYLLIFLCLLSPDPYQQRAVIVVVEEPTRGTQLGTRTRQPMPAVRNGSQMRESRRR